MMNRRIAFAAAAMSAALALTACGSSDSTPKSQPAPSKTTSSTPTAAVYQPLSKADFVSLVSRHASTLRSAHMTMTSAALSANADVAYGNQVAMKMTATMAYGGQTMDMKMTIIGTEIYMQVPGLTPAGKYFSLDLTKMPGASAYAKLFTNLKDLGLGSMAKMLKDAAKSVRYVGTEKINGVSTRHYVVVVDTMESLKAMGQPAANIPDSMKTVTEDVYLDDQQRPLRVKTNMPAPIGAMQVDVSKWNVPVVVTPPPAADVQPFPAGALG